MVTNGRRHAVHLEGQLYCCAATLVCLVNHLNQNHQQQEAHDDRTEHLSPKIGIGPALWFLTIGDCSTLSYLSKGCHTQQSHQDLQGLVRQGFGADVSNHMDAGRMENPCRLLGNCFQQASTPNTEMPGSPRNHCGGTRAISNLHCSFIVTGQRYTLLRSGLTGQGISLSEKFRDCSASNMSLTGSYKLRFSGGLREEWLPGRLPPHGWSQGAHKDGLNAPGIVNLRFHLLAILILDESLSVLINWRVFFHDMWGKRRISVSEQRFHPVVRHP
jgi:hypothetical protein